MMRSRSLVKCLVEPTAEPDVIDVDSAADTIAEAPPPEHDEADTREQITRRRGAEVHALLNTGATITRIATALAVDRTTARRYARAASPEELTRPPESMPASRNVL
jgi:hypothetical protein